MSKRKNSFIGGVKASTAVLMGILVVFLFCLTSYVSSVNSRYAAGDYSYVNSDKSRYKKIRMPPSSVVVVENIHNCLIIASDSLSAEVDIQDARNLQVSSDRDTIRIVAVSAPSSKILLYLPSGSELVAKACRLQLKGSLHHDSPPSYRIFLADSDLTASGQGLHAFLKELAVAGSGKARLEVFKHFHIESLVLRDVDSIQLAQGWQIGALKTSFEKGNSTEILKVGDSISVVAVAR